MFSEVMTTKKVLTTALGCAAVLEKKIALTSNVICILIQKLSLLSVQLRFIPTFRLEKSAPLLNNANTEISPKGINLLMLSFYANMCATEINGS